MMVVAVVVVMTMMTTTMRNWCEVNSPRWGIQLQSIGYSAERDVSLHGTWDSTIH